MKPDLCIHSSFFCMPRMGRESYVDIGRYETEHAEPPNAQNPLETAQAELDDPFAIAAIIERSIPEPIDPDDDESDPFRTINLFSVCFKLDRQTDQIINSKILHDHAPTSFDKSFFF